MDPSNLQQPKTYAATHGLIQRSVDGGATWQAVLGDEPGALARATGRDQKDQNRGTSNGAPIQTTTLSTMPSRTKSMKRYPPGP